MISGSACRLPASGVGSSCVILIPDQRFRAHVGLWDSDPIEKAHAYLASEADRRAALALSEEKAQEARLIKAHQEGFQAAMEMLGMASFACDAALPPKELGQGRVRRNIRDLILCELSFSGQPMTAAQIARAIDYHPERTEAALQRMEETGQLLRSAEGRWAVGTSPIDKLTGTLSLAATAYPHRCRTRLTTKELGNSQHRSPRGLGPRPDQ